MDFDVAGTGLVPRQIEGQVRRLGTSVVAWIDQHPGLSYRNGLSGQPHHDTEVDNTRVRASRRRLR